MELTLNELKILRNALNKKLRDAHILSTEYSDIKKSLYKVNAEIKRIEKDIKQKALQKVKNEIKRIKNELKMTSKENIDEILDEILEAALRLQADGAEIHKIVILAPKYFIDMLHDEFEKITGDKVNKEDKITIFGYPIFPSFENKITVYDEDIVVDLGRVPIKIELI